MKKFMIVLVALMIVPIASAVASPVSWDVASNTDGTYTITLMSDMGLSDASIGLATATAGELTPGAWDVAFKTADAGYNGAAFGMGANELLSATGAADPGVYVSGAIYTFTYAGPATVITIGDLPAFGITSYVRGAEGLISLSGQEIAVPEPMTMALMGLGGLFIRRRRA